jgi:cold shock CspA family protein
MNIPDYLVSQVREGKAVLFLGAGASREATSASGAFGPTGAQLGKLIATKFLGGKYSEHPLNQIAEYAGSESDVATVQEFIKGVVDPLQPTVAHFGMTEFIWHGIATTNYERLIEKAYEEAPKRPLQKIRPLIENGDRVEENSREAENVLLLKLHGCTTRIANPDCPLILTTDQYIEHRQGRDRLFEVLRTWGYEHPIVFVGYSLQDPDIRMVLSDLTKNAKDNRPRYYLVAPDVDEISTRFWDSKKVAALKASFGEFMASLDAAIPAGFRALAPKLRAAVHPIEQKFRAVGAAPSKSLWQFLETDVDYVNSLDATALVQPANFYKGFNPGFAAIEQELDVRRQMGDTMLADYFLRDVKEQSGEMEVLLLKAHAGAGKSVMLRRAAWDASRVYDRICLYLKPHGIISTAAIQELVALCRERIFLFVDDAADRVRELQSLFKNIGPEGKRLTVILGERINEWNMQGQPIAPFVTEEYELKYLTSGEIDKLLLLLEKNHSLGTLEHLDADRRHAELSERAGRQLLVALHEATSGRPFEEILVDEFSKIEPYEAQRIYLTICVLNRLNIPIRAGLVARVHGVPFSEFKERFFAPLEHVVFAENDPVVRDYTYRARHPHIADVIFMHILANPEERFDAYVRCLRALSLAYTSDWKAFWQMVRGRVLMELFPNQAMVKQIFEAAQELVGKDAHLLHQMAIYEMNRPDGSLKEGASLLNQASELAPYDASIKHSMAELKLREVDSGKTELEKSKLLKEAMRLSLGLISDDKSSPYPYHTLAKVGLRKLQEGIETNAPDIELEKLLKDLEQNLFDSLQRFPGDAYLLETESRLASLLGDTERLVSSLEKAFAANNRNSFVALRLAAVYERRDQPQKSTEILEKALAANNAEKRLHYALAKLIVKSGANEDGLLYHLQRSFSEGDSNYDAQVLYGRQLYLNKDFENSRQVFRRLSQAKIGVQYRNKLLYKIDGQKFTGKVSKLEASYCFITRDGAGDWVYSHVTTVDESTWKSLVVGTRVEFGVGFNVRGATAFDIQVVGHAEEVRQDQMKLFRKTDRN